MTFYVVICFDFEVLFEYSVLLDIKNTDTTLLFVDDNVTDTHEA